MTVAQTVQKSCYPSIHSMSSFTRLKTKAAIHHTLSTAGLRGWTQHWRTAGNKAQLWHRLMPAESGPNSCPWTHHKDYSQGQLVHTLYAWVRGNTVLIDTSIPLAGKLGRDINCHVALVSIMLINWCTGLLLLDDTVVKRTFLNVLMWRRWKWEESSPHALFTKSFAVSSSTVSRNDFSQRRTPPPVPHIESAVKLPTDVQLEATGPTTKKGSQMFTNSLTSVNGSQLAWCVSKL